MAEERHAGSVERVSDAVETDRSAVQEVTMGTQAYGRDVLDVPAGP